MDEPSYARRVDCFWRRTLDGILVLGAQADDPVHITGSGAFAWELLAEPTTIAALVGRMADEFGVPVEVLVDEFTELVDGLERQGLLVRGPVTDR